MQRRLGRQAQLSELELAVSVNLDAARAPL